MRLRNILESILPWDTSNVTMFSKIVSVLLLASVASSAKLGHHSGYSQPQPSYDYSPPAVSYDHQNQKGMPFSFGYSVEDDLGNDFEHNSDSDGHVTKGEYSVDLPDGRTQIVKYTADSQNGYNAEVTYEGEARPYEPPHGSSQGSYSYQEPEPARTPDSLYGPPVKQPQSLYGAPF